MPIGERTYNLMKNIFINEENEHYTLSGKTGWSFSEGQNDNGWFVGYIEKKEKVYYFATNVEPTEKFNMDNFIPIRKEMTMQALRELGIIENL